MLASQRAPAFSGDYRTSRARISSILLALQILRRGRIPRRKPRQRALLNRQRQMKLRHRSSTMIALQLLRRGRIPWRNPHQRALQNRQRQMKLRHRSKGSLRARDLVSFIYNGLID